jgi:hypothetical protein
MHADSRPANVFAMRKTFTSAASKGSCWGQQGQRLGMQDMLNG